MPLSWAAGRARPWGAQCSDWGCSYIPCCVPHREAFTIPLIPLGLKETKDVDFSVVLKVNLKAPNSVFKMEIGHLRWCMPVVPVTWEAEVRGSLEPRSWRLQ